MAVIHELQLPGIPQTVVEETKQLLGFAFWGWFDKHQNDVVFKTKVWFISVSIRVGQLESVFTQVFGQR